ncbi:dethiobiotin synthase [Govanella unica]|uniref:ATP-dependent dethiobiotin synthetase BioD n=1 Tax=Govanella unica TaxID=2975056 RepID=A0A9X3Z5V0_9PROT|nr:dethiobiotin synthase [Govania unica]MDA5192481.1 dethiobiotin synthase [Govania unica]
MRRYFITATGTEIGKTFVTALLTRQARARGLSVRALKPVLSGYEDGMTESDSHQLLAAQGLDATADNIHAITPWRFRAPLSPDMAAAREGKVIDVAALGAFSKAALVGPENLVLIEGVGGAFVPLDDRHTVADWMMDTGAPALVIAGSYLGTISHSIATVTALQTRGIPVAAIILSASPISPVPLEETAATIRRHLDIPVLILPRLGDDLTGAPDLLTALL